MAILDINNDLYIYSIENEETVKIKTMVSSFKWHEKYNLLTYTDRNKLSIVYSISSFTIDQELNKKCIENV